MKKRSGLNLKNVLAIIFVNISIILVFTAIDYLTHHLNWTSLAVPEYYFRNKVIFGVLIGIVAYLILRNRKIYISQK